MPEIPEVVTAYCGAKEEAVVSRKSPVSGLLNDLDDAVRDQLFHDAPGSVVEEAIDAVLAHPRSTWTRETLSYRIRCLHY